MNFQGDIFVAIRQSVPQAGKSVGIDVGINAPTSEAIPNNMALTDIAIRQTKPRPKPFKLTDGAGLHLLVAPTGARLWRLAYRFAGKQVTLADARSARDAARKLLSAGSDPSVQRKLDKQSASITFRLIGGELLEKLKREGRAPRTLAKTRWLLDFAFAAFGDRPIVHIAAPEILLALRRVEARGKYESARRLRSTCGMVFRYAIATGRAERDPTADLRGALTAPSVNHRAAILEPEAVGALLRAIDGLEGYKATAMALRLAPLVFVRPGELRHAEWKEFDFGNAEWRIPAAKMKMRRPHRVPLSGQVLDILKEVEPITSCSRRLCPSGRSAMRRGSENSLNAALRRLGYRADEMSAHGFRSMAATRLSEMGRWSPDAIERQLAHQEQNAVRRAYTHGAEYWAE